MCERNRGAHRSGASLEESRAVNAKQGEADVGVEAAADGRDSRDSTRGRQDKV